MSAHWRQWHEQYADPASGLADRLAAVRRCIGHHLDASAPEPVHVISACSGDGRDLLGALAGRPDAARVSGVLVEWDAALADRARTAAGTLPARIEVRQADAGLSDSYAGAAPADLVLLCGVFGNISDHAVRQTIEATTQLCAPGASVVWTRHREPPDLTPSIRAWFVDAGFEELGFDAPEGATWSVGVCRLAREPAPLQLGQRWFTFLR